VLYTYGDDLLSQERNSATNYFHYDGLGSTRALSNASGSLTDSYDYAAFGEVLAQTGSTENLYQYTGEQFDSDLDQTYLRARYYDQNIGRFPQQDTWMGHDSTPISLNKYLYGNADPTNWTDPTGHFGISSFSASSSINGILSTINTVNTINTVFKLATGEEEFSAKSAGLTILLSLAPGSSISRSLANQFKKKTGKNLIIPCVGNSFIEGTLIHTSDGLKPIQEIEIGDFVISFNEGTGELEPKKVTHLIQNESQYQLSSIVVNGEEIIATADHPFFLSGEWVEAGELSVGDVLLTSFGNAAVLNNSTLTRSARVFNFTVEDNHNYFVGKSGVLVHNENRDCVVSVSNMREFFQTAFGAAIKNSSSKLGRQYQGQSLYRVSKKTGSLKKGDHYYLDGLHKNHLEVFDKNGNFKFVLNLDGSKNPSKTASALGRNIKDIL